MLLQKRLRTSFVCMSSTYLFCYKDSSIAITINWYTFFQAKKRQIQLDTTYGSSMRELELLLDNFQIEKPEEHKRQGDLFSVIYGLPMRNSV